MKGKAASDRLYGLVGEDIFGGESFSAQSVAELLDRHQSDGVERLDLFLSSDGGSVGEGLTIYAQIQRYPGEVTMHVDGRAISIASVIALAGKRLVMPASAMLMVHAPWAPVVGNAARHRKAADDLEVMAETMRGIYVAASGQSDAKVRALMDAETWLTAQDALDLGFVDQVVPNVGARAMGVTPSLVLDSYRNTPEALRTVKTESALARLESLLMRQRIEVDARGARAAGKGASPRVK
jgi:ATP-dependent Clp protease, protease subunit